MYNVLSHIHNSSSGSRINKLIWIWRKHKHWHAIPTQKHTPHRFKHVKKHVCKSCKSKLLQKKHILSLLYDNRKKASSSIADEMERFKLKYQRLYMYTCPIHRPVYACVCVSQCVHTHTHIRTLFVNASNTYRHCWWIMNVLERERTRKKMRQSVQAGPRKGSVQPSCRIVYKEDTHTHNRHHYQTPTHNVFVPDIR